MLLSELLLGIHTLNSWQDCAIAGITCDSRRVEEGFVFAAIRGGQADGHRFAPMAAEKGAAVILAEEALEVDAQVILVESCRDAFQLLCANYFGHPERDMTFLGVTGTNGKTSATQFVKSILDGMGIKAGLIGTVCNQIGAETFPAAFTTPEPYQLFALLRKMRDAGVQTVVMEVSSQAMDQRRADSLPFAVAGFTNLTQDHLDYHLTMENYKEAKARLFSLAKSGVFNADDAAGRELAARFGGLTYSAEGEADLRAEAISVTVGGVSYRLRMGEKAADIKVSTPGLFTVHNTLCAAGVLLAAGYTFEQVTAGLNQIPKVPGRAEVITEGYPFSVMLDYAHTPDALENILTTVRSFVEGRVITLFGCGGDRDRTKRPLMAQAAAKHSDLLIVTSDNPRTEEPAKILEDIRAGLLGTKVPYWVIEDRRTAIGFALLLAQDKDLILLAGKGHEDYQILGTEKIRFDEKEIVHGFLRTLTTARVAKALGQPYNGRNFYLTKVQTDSRKVEEHTLFAAFAGEKVDAHSFIPALDEKYKNIAFLVSAMPEKPTKNPCFLVEDVQYALGLLAKEHLSALPARIVGVTGSVGKTTTKNFILSALNASVKVSGTAGNMNNELGVPLTALAVDAADEAAVIEMGMRGLGQIDYLTQFVTPDIAVITNIGVAHLELLKSRENIARAKLELVDALPADGVALLNGDEPLLRGARSDKKCLYFGLGAENDYRAEEIEGSSFTACYPDGRLRLELQVEGEHQIMNALAAFGVGHLLGLAPEKLKEGIEAFHGDGRRQFTETVGGVCFIDDTYNAAPDSMAAALKLLAKKQPRRIAVLGDMLELGSFEQEGHRSVGALCGALGIDLVVTVGKRAEMIFNALPAETEKYHFADRAAAQAHLEGLLKAGDTVLFKASNAMGFDCLVRALKERIGK